ncbi:hypothetical protein V8E36_003547 [Tilletia maclaganii]
MQAQGKASAAYPLHLFLQSRPTCKRKADVLLAFLQRTRASGPPTRGSIKSLGSPYSRIFNTVSVPWYDSVQL